MKISKASVRLLRTDKSAPVLTSSQNIVFSHWLAGFEAQGQGIPLHCCPNFVHWQQKVKKVWREGWMAGAATDKISRELFSR
jgi:hypothetical protein